MRNVVTADVVVIGGGIVGAACAYYLSKAGARVRLLERDFPAAGTSRACDGLILCHDKSSAAGLGLAQAAAAAWAGLGDALDADFEYRRPGVLVLAESEAELAEAVRQAAEMARAGVQYAVLGSAALLALEPNLAPDLAGAIYYPDEAQVDARLATLAMIDAAQLHGAVLETGVSVTGLRLDDRGQVCGVTTTHGQVPAGAVVCAAGVWSDEIVRAAGIDLPIRPRKGHILVTGRVPGFIRHPMLESGYTATVASASEARQAALVAEMTAGETLLLGSTREFCGMDRSVSTTALAAIAARARRFLPALASKSIQRCYAGLRPWSPDHLPLVGPVPPVPGLYLATGHEGAGIDLAPVTGQIIAGWIAGERPSALAAAVRPERFESCVGAARRMLGESALA